jgi:hypothetical protein
MRPHRPRTAAALLAGVLIASLANGSPAQAGPRDDAALRFVAAAPRITLQHWVGEPTFLDVGAHVVAGKVPFEIRAKRASYRDPIVAKQWIKSGGTTRKINLPAGLLNDFSGFPAFSHLPLKDSTGATVVDRDETFCPNNSAVRTRPDAPDRSPYPWGCPFNPFTLGSVWGIQAGWATSEMSGWWGQPVDLADGVYSARLSVNQRYRDLFGIPADQSAVDVEVTISTIGPIDGRERRAASTDAAGPPVAGPRAPAGRARTPTSPSTACSTAASNSPCAAARRRSAWPTRTSWTTRCPRPTGGRRTPTCTPPAATSVRSPCARCSTWATATRTASTRAPAR